MNIGETTLNHFLTINIQEVAENPKQSRQFKNNQHYENYKKPKGKEKNSISTPNKFKVQQAK